MKAVVAIIIVVILGVGGFMLLKSKPKTNSSSTGTNNSTVTGSDNKQPVGSISSNSVSIADMAFSPSSITVKKGTKVTWANNDSTSHTVTGDSGGPDSGTLGSGQSYSFTFDKTGTFKYHCNFHSGMTGSVIVTE